MRGDLLPLPLGLSIEDVAVATEYFSGNSAIKLTDQELSELGAKCWLDAAVLTLNSMWASPQTSC